MGGDQPMIPDGPLRVFDEFSGCGGTSTGASRVPHTELVFAANHHPMALASHAANFPDVEHYPHDVQKAEISRFPYAHLFVASPACPPWTDARGRKRDFDKSNQQVLFDTEGGKPDPVTMRNRLLMEEVPRYLRYWAQRRGRPVLAGMVENVVQCRMWDDWPRWLGEIKALGYHVRVIALNSMHVRAPVSPTAPQSRDRLFVAYIHASVGRLPDWDKWLRPWAYCPACDARVQALQVFKRPGNDMGRYRQQYVYRCPAAACRNTIVEPQVLPAAVAIDWTLPGQRIGDRSKPLAAKTLARIEAGLRRYARPITLEAAGNTFERRPGVRAWPVDAPLTTQTTTATKGIAYEPVIVPAGGTWRDAATSVAEPMPARTTRENDGVAVPPLLVPMEGRPGKEAAPVSSPLRTQTARNETGLVILPPFQVPMRGGGDQERARPISDPLGTVTASGNHHGLVLPQPLPLVMRNNTGRGDGAEHTTPVTEPLRTLTTAGHQSLLIPYYGNGNPRSPEEPLGTLPTRDRWALAAQAAAEVDLDDVLFRMLEPHEIARGMAFDRGYIVMGCKRDRVRQYGNAVPPPVAEVIVSALVEALTGEELATGWELAA